MVLTLKFLLRLNSFFRDKIVIGLFQKPVSNREPAIKQTVLLGAVQVYRVCLPLESIYRWGPCGPDGYSFKEYFFPDTNEVRGKITLGQCKDRALVESVTQRSASILTRVGCLLNRIPFSQRSGSEARP